LKIERREGRLDCIVLAAGASARMGRSKLALPFGASAAVAGGAAPPAGAPGSGLPPTILGALVSSALAADLRVIIVARPGDPSPREFAGALVEVVLNPDPSRGMISSLREGLGRVRAESFFFTPADMPFIGPQVYRELASRAQTSREPGRPVIPTHGGRRGHPVLMPSALIPAIMALPPDRPLKTLIDGSAPIFVEMAEDSILRDIDTMEEYEKALADADSRAGLRIVTGAGN
jgi:molybdenum cofactor cytidylyltransferase